MKNMQTIKELQELFLGYQRKLDNLDAAIRGLQNERTELSKELNQTLAKIEERTIVLEAAYLLKTQPNRVYREAAIEQHSLEHCNKSLYREMEGLSMTELDEVISVYEGELAEFKAVKRDLTVRMESCVSQIAALYGRKTTPAMEKSATKKKMDRYISVVSFS